MSLPIIMFSKGCCGKLVEKTTHPRNELKLTNKETVCFLSSLALDVIGTITLVVLGTLGATHVLTLPPAATYTMIGVSGLIGLLWVAMLARAICCKVPPYRAY